ncbi:MAG: 3-dehydroquinate synthase II family protein [Angustibacter sp.]
MANNRLCWLDLRGAYSAPIAEEAAHQRIDALIIDDVAQAEDLPPTVRRVLVPPSLDPSPDLRGADVVLLPGPSATWPELKREFPDCQFGQLVDIVDADSLAVACAAAQTEPVVLLRFRDSTKIPLEIVIAAAANASGTMITAAHSVAEAEVIFGVLEHGSDGVLLPARAVGEATALRRLAEDPTTDLDLVELEVTGTAQVGMGERACVDTCSYLDQDEGILVGSTSKGMVLCVSETHPLPYMPTRPFRVNAGAIHSYTLGLAGRTSYLSELRAGGQVLAVNTKGRGRPVTVGRVKIESRPLLSVDLVAADGREVNLILQDDWHVRVLGPGAVVLNSTELRPGDRVLGFLPTQDRHVGYPIQEFCREQ